MQQSKNPTRRYFPRVVLISAVALCIASVMFAIAMQYVYNNSSVAPAALWILGKGGEQSDSWMPMIAAIEWFSQNGAGMYTALFFEQGIKFQYPPSSLLPLMTIDAVAPLSYQLLNGINGVAFAATPLLIGLFIYILFGKLGGERGRLRIYASIFCAVACLVYYPLAVGLRIGQVQVIINLLFVVSCICFVVERKIVAGVCVGLIIMIKPQFVLFLIWALLRRDFKFGIAAFVVISTVSLTALLVFGIQDHLEYLSVLSFISGRGEAYFPNQSVNGILNRILGHDVGWDPAKFPPYDIVVHIGTILTSIVLIVGSLVFPRGGNIVHQLVAFQLAALSFTMASPVAWEHHYGILAPTLATLLVVGIVGGLSRIDLWLIGAAYLLTTVFIGFADGVTVTPVVVIVQSHLYIGALLVMLVMWRIGMRNGLVPLHFPKGTGRAADD